MRKEISVDEKYNVTNGTYDSIGWMFFENSTNDRAE